MANGDSKITLKLLIDASAQKVMFAESGKDFVDFMCSLLTLPLCSVIKQHLSPQAKAGSMGKLYQSVEKLNEKDFAAIKPAQLQPKISVVDGASPLLLPQPEPTTELKYYLCGNCRKRFSVVRDVRCACGGSMSNALSVIDRSGLSSSVGMGNGRNTAGGFHKGVVKYVITNDLRRTTVMASGSNSTKITLKLLIDTRSQKVLFAEAGKEFVDFIFSLLTLPLGSVIKLLSPSLMVGSIGKLYQSVDKLNETYLVANKATLLQPMISTIDGATPLLLAAAEATTEIKYHLCNSCYKKFTTAKNIVCPTCKVVMAADIKLVVPSLSSPASVGAAGNGGQSCGGFVKEVITYMITDDLEVTPMSAISSITLINRFSVKKDVHLEEKAATVGLKEGLALLQASLNSPTALTDVFLNKKAKSPA